MLYNLKWERGKRVPRYKILDTGEEIEGKSAKLPPANLMPTNNEAAYYKLTAVRRALGNPDGDLAVLAASVGGPAGLAPETATHFLFSWCNLTAVRLNADWRGPWT